MVRIEVSRGVILQPRGETGGLPDFAPPVLRCAPRRLASSVAAPACTRRTTHRPASQKGSRRCFDAKGRGGPIRINRCRDPLTQRVDERSRPWDPQTNGVTRRTRQTACGEQRPAPMAQPFIIEELRSKSTVSEDAAPLPHEGDRMALLSRPKPEDRLEGVDHRTGGGPCPADRPDMERPCQVSSVASRQVGAFGFAAVRSGEIPGTQHRRRPRRRCATVDHSDIRGSEPHNRDPSGAASD